MGTGGALLLCALFYLSSTVHPACSCPEISRVYCTGHEADTDWQPCWNHLFRCRNHSMEIKFGGREPPFKVLGRGQMDGLKLEVGDPTLSPKFAGTNCDFLYTFSQPGPLFDPPPPPPPPPPTPPPPPPSTLQSLPHSPPDVRSYCKEDDYITLLSELFKGYQAGLCTTYYFHSSSKRLEEYYRGDPELRNACQPPGHADSPALIWRVSLDNNTSKTNIVSVGFSSRRLLDEGCFDFNSRIYGHRCDSDSEGSYTRGEKRRRLRRKLMIGTALGISGVLLTCIIFWCWRYKKHSCFRLLRAVKSTNLQNIEAFLEQYISVVPRRYRYGEVKKMTKSFTEKLGQGGYGTVFKGKLPDGRLVAVKVFKSKESTEEFINEVASIGRTHHINIVSLLGFCCEGSKRALVYEFMPNGSLDKFIFRKTSAGDVIAHLGWEKLLEIATGIARGLEYLHRGCITRIVHFDIKPHNILLDEDFCPKISDFGLAKSCPPKQSILSTMDARGTIGYIAPEVFSREFGVVSSKSDVYSYGKMVLEMVSGRINIDARTNSTSDVYFPHWIYEHFDDKVIFQIRGITDETEKVAKKMILVGLWCIQTSPSCRPSINKVLEMLEGNLEDIQMPQKPVLSPPESSRINPCTVFSSPECSLIKSCTQSIS